MIFRLLSHPPTRYHWQILLISLGLLAGISPSRSATTLSVIPDLRDELYSSASISTDSGFYLAGHRPWETLQDTALWRFDGDSLQRIPLPDDPDCMDCAPLATSLIHSWRLHRAGQDLYLSMLYGPPDGPSTHRWWWSDGFKTRLLSPHPALDEVLSIEQEDGVSYLFTSDALWVLEGAEDRISPVATFQEPEYLFLYEFDQLKLHQGEPILWTWVQENDPIRWRLRQWVIRDQAREQRLDILFEDGPGRPLWAGDRWFLQTHDTLWQILDGLATPIPGIDRPGNLTVIGDALYLTAFTPALGREPYRVRGSELTLLGDLNPGPEDFDVFRFIACGQRVCFYGIDAGSPSIFPYIWWSSDGSNTRPLLGDVDIADFATLSYNDALYIRATPVGGRSTLYRSFDGETVEPLLESCDPQYGFNLGWVAAGSLFVERRDCGGGYNFELLRITDAITPLVNLSLNSLIAPTATLTPGFIVSGNGGRYALLGESQYQNGNPLPDPVLRLRNLASGEIIQQNDQWRDLPQVDALLNGLRAPSSDNDAALVVDLPPGSYVAELRDSQGRGGQALLSVQQMDGMRELVNISANTRVPSEGVTPGFVVQGDGGRFVVLGEAQYQTGEPLADPTITVRDLFTGVVLDSNDDWRDHPTADEVAREVRAPAGDRDAALAVDLPPGAYVVELRDGAGGAGQALISIQQIPGS